MRFQTSFIILLSFAFSYLKASEVPPQHEARWYSKVSFVYDSHNLCFLSERDDEYFRSIRLEFEACSLNIESELSLDFEGAKRYSVAIVDQVSGHIPDDLFMIDRLSFSKNNHLNLRYKIYVFLMSRLIDKDHAHKEALQNWFALALIYKDCRELILKETARSLQRTIFNSFGADYLRTDLENGKLKTMKEILKLKYDYDSNSLSFYRSEYAFYTLRTLRSHKVYTNFKGILEAFSFDYSSEVLKKTLEKKTENSLKDWFIKILDLKLYSKHYPFPPKKIEKYLSKLLSFEVLLANEDGEIALQTVSYRDLEEHESHLKGKNDILRSFSNQLQILKLRSPVIFNELLELYEEALDELKDEDYDDFADDLEEAQELELKLLTFYKKIYQQMRRAEKASLYKKMTDNQKSHLDDFRRDYPNLLKDYLDYLDSIKEWYK